MGGPQTARSAPVNRRASQHLEYYQLTTMQPQLHPQTNAARHGPAE